MDQKAFDQVVKDFQDHCKKWPENVQGMVNALRHKLESVDFGVDTSGADKAINKALGIVPAVDEPEAVEAVEEVIA